MDFILNLLSSFDLTGLVTQGVEYVIGVAVAGVVAGFAYVKGKAAGTATKLDDKAVETVAKATKDAIRKELDKADNAGA
jgi:uncharacterized membrane protein